MKSFVIILVLPLVILVMADKTKEHQYCDICQYHTLCDTQVGSKCVNHRSKPPNYGDKKLILDIHNRLRNTVALGKETRGKPGPQYSAANMMKVEWDDELAKIAQRAADQCVFGHDCKPCRSVLNDRFKVGQNVAIQITSDQKAKVNYTGMIESWYFSEIILMDKTFAKDYEFGKWGHCSQMIWWNSRLVGCGASFYDIENSNAQILFCNYGSAGNIAGGKMYETGRAASKCPDNTRKDAKYTGLCAITTSKKRGTFHTDKTLLGFPPGTEYVPEPCQKRGFRIFDKD